MKLRDALLYDKKQNEHVLLLQAVFDGKGNYVLLYDCTWHVLIWQSVTCPPFKFRI